MAARVQILRRAVIAGGAVVLAAATGAAFLGTGSRPAKAVGVVYKSPTCGCCASWSERMAAAGLPLEVRHPADLDVIKREYGIGYGMSSCHTAVIDGYAIEGHVPVEQVRRLLAERPQARGLAVPGMPAGAPGMEGPDARPYTVYLLGRDGSAKPVVRVVP